jgi:hypothetical protein
MNDLLKSLVPYVPALISGLFLLLGIVLGWLPNLLRLRMERKDRYAFALLEKRFEVNQECYSWGERIARVLFDDDKKPALLIDAKYWYHCNSLYLSPEVRKTFRKVVYETGTYDITLQHARETSRAHGINDPKSKKANEELKKKFNSIMDRIKESLESDVNASFWKHQ